MIELGDLREGVLVDKAPEVAFKKMCIRDSIIPVDDPLEFFPVKITEAGV